MKKSKYDKTKILAILKEAEAGMTVGEISRKYGISNGTFYNWKSKYAGMSGSEIRRTRKLEEENGKLKHMYAIYHWKIRFLRNSLKKTSNACQQKSFCPAGERKRAKRYISMQCS